MQILPRRVAPVQIPSSPRRLAQPPRPDLVLIASPRAAASILPLSRPSVVAVPEQKEKKNERGEKKGLGDGGPPSRRKRKVREERRRVLVGDGELGLGS
ncbi:unnamed protein product [Linum trigynum]|uniref:Uncharacterized protein n=1 Tax=Linum trigynum TaxID=586398 RepID=A0AAV2ECG8_9ROSI